MIWTVLDLRNWCYFALEGFRNPDLLKSDLHSESLDEDPILTSALDNCIEVNDSILVRISIQLYFKHICAI